MIVFLALVLSMLVYFIKRATKDGKTLFVRRIPGVRAIEEATGRAAELGRSISFSTGLTQVGPALYACLGVLHYVATLAAYYKSKLFVPQSVPDALPLVEDTVRDAYLQVGRKELFEPQRITFLSEDQFAYAAGYMGIIHREKVGAAFLFGSFAAEALVLAEAGQQVGAMQVGASISPEQVPFFISSCDFTLIGEELFAAAAYLTREPIQLATLLAQDYSKLLFILFIVIGVLIATINQLQILPPIPQIDLLFSYSLWH
jgi:hypothetical protein